MLFLGVDIGTSGLKVGAVDASRGEFVGWASGNYSLEHPRTGWAELRAEDYRRAMLESLKELARTINLREIRALSVSGQGQTFVPVDAEGKALQNAWTWIDGRASREAEELGRTFGEDKTFAKTGVSIGAGSFASMLMYLRKNDPAIFGRTSKFLTTNSYLIRWLSGRAVIDENQGAMCGIYDWHERRWWREMLDKIGVDEKQLPEPLASGTVVGKILPDVADELGLSREMLVVTGANDQTANAVGSGLADENNALVILGTALVIFNVLADHIVPHRAGIWSPYPILGKHYQLGCTNSGCGTLDWAKNLLAKELDFPKVFEEASKSPAGCHGVRCLIDLDARAGNESEYRGVLAGLSRKTDRQDILRAVLEGVVFSVRELCEDMGWNLRGKVVRAAGGGARSDLWLQMLADVLGCEIQRLGHEQSGVAGGAIMAAVATGAFSSYLEAMERCVRTAGSFSPSAESPYEDIYQDFKKLRRAGDEYYREYAFDLIVP